MTRSPSSGGRARTSRGPLPSPSAARPPWPRGGLHGDAARAPQQEALGGAARRGRPQGPRPRGGRCQGQGRGARRRTGRAQGSARGQRGRPGSGFPSRAPRWGFAGLLSPPQRDPGAVSLRQARVRAPRLHFRSAACVPPRSPWTPRVGTTRLPSFFWKRSRRPAAETKRGSEAAGVEAPIGGGCRAPDVMTRLVLTPRARGRQNTPGPVPAASRGNQLMRRGPCPLGRGTPDRDRPDGIPGPAPKPGPLHWAKEACVRRGVTLGPSHLGASVYRSVERAQPLALPSRVSLRPSVKLLAPRQRRTPGSPAPTRAPAPGAVPGARWQPRPSLLQFGNSSPRAAG